MIKVSSSCKILNLKLNEIDTENTKNLLLELLNIESIINDQEFNLIINNLSGCARSVQYFIDYFQQNEQKEMSIETCKIFISKVD